MSGGEVARQLSQALADRNEDRFRAIAFVHRHEIIAALSTTPPVATTDQKNIAYDILKTELAAVKGSEMRTGARFDASLRAMHKFAALAPTPPAAASEGVREALVERVAKILAGYFAVRPWDGMAEDRSDLRKLSRTGYDINEANRDDCRASAEDALAAIIALAPAPESGETKGLITNDTLAYTPRPAPDVEAIANAYTQAFAEQSIRGLGPRDTKLLHDLFVQAALSVTLARSSGS